MSLGDTHWHGQNAGVSLPKKTPQMESGFWSPNLDGNGSEQQPGDYSWITASDYSWLVLSVIHHCTGAGADF